MKRKLHKALSLLLCWALLCAAVPLPALADEEYVPTVVYDEELGPVWLCDGDVISEDVYFTRNYMYIGKRRVENFEWSLFDGPSIRGTLTLTNGARLHIGGCGVTIEADCRINGDIVLEDELNQLYHLDDSWQDNGLAEWADLYVDGSVYGTIRTEMPPRASAERTELIDGCVPNWHVAFVHVRAGGYAEHLQLSGAMGADIAGRVDTMEIAGSEYIDYLTYDIGMPSIQPGGYVRRLIDSDDCAYGLAVLNRGGRVDEVIARHYNIWGDHGASFGTITLGFDNGGENTDEAYCWLSESTADRIVATDAAKIGILGGSHVGEIQSRNTAMTLAPVISDFDGFWFNAERYDESAVVCGENTAVATIDRISLEGSYWGNAIDAQVGVLTLKDCFAMIGGHVDTVVAQDATVRLSHDFTFYDYDDVNSRMSKKASAYHFGNMTVADAVYAQGCDLLANGSVGAIICEESPAAGWSGTLTLTGDLNADWLYMPDETVFRIESDTPPAVHVGTLMLGQRDALADHTAERFSAFTADRLACFAAVPDMLPVAADMLCLTNGQDAQVLPDGASCARTIAAPAVAEARLSDGTPDNPLPLPLGESAVLKTDDEDAWFRLDVQEYDSVFLSLTAPSGLGALWATAPDQAAAHAVSQDETGALALVCQTAGQCLIRLAGGAGEYVLSADVRPAQRIDYTILEHRASYQGAGAGFSADPSLYTLSVCDEDGEAVPFIALNRALLLPAAELPESGILQLNAASLRSEWADASCAVRLGSDTSAVLDSIQKGYYTTHGNSDVNVYLYDANGDYFETPTYEHGTFTSSPLDNGGYSVVMVRGPRGAWRLNALSDYADFGLKAGEHYRLDSFTARTGYIESYPNPTVPDEPDVAADYLETGSGLRAGAATCAEGELLLMRLRYALKAPYGAAENLSILLNLSENLEMVEGSLVSGRETLPFETDGQRVLISVDQAAGELIWYVRCTGGSEVSALATLNLGDALHLCLGAATSQVCTLTFNAPAQTAGRAGLFGTAPAGSALWIYDGETYLTSAAADASGRWSALCDFGATENDVTHTLRAEIVSGEGMGAIAQRTVIHSASTPQIEYFTMYYYEHAFMRKLELDGGRFGSTPLQYSYDPRKPFTFAVRMSEGAAIENLYIVGTAGSESHRLEAKYDAATGEWIASGFFDPNNQNFVPEAIAISFVEPLPEITYPSLSADEMNAALENTRAALSRLGFQLANEWINQEAVPTGEALEQLSGDVPLYACDVQLASSGGESMTLCRLTLSARITHGEEINPAVELTEGGLTLAVPLDASALTAGSKSASLLDFLSTRAQAEGKINWDAVINWGEFAHDAVDTIIELEKRFDTLIDLGDDANFYDVFIKDVSEEIEKRYEDFSNANAAFDALIGTLQNILDARYIHDLNKDILQLYSDIGKWHNAAIFCTPCQGYVDRLAQLENDTILLEKHLKTEVWRLYGRLVLDIAGKIASAIKELKKVNQVNDAMKSIVDETIDPFSLKLEPIRDEMERISDEANAIAAALWRCIQEANKNKENSCPMPDFPIPNPVMPSIDPSGYVFEAVVSNRVEGVTASCFYRDENGDMIWWNAAEYGQHNPLSTDGDGYYEWFVPVGDWKVVYEKDGYEAAESDWLPVPPPQTEVNQSLVSLEAPFVTSARFYGDSCVLEFSRYIRLETITADAVSLSEGPFSLEALNAETLCDGSGDAATRFRLTLDSASDAGEITLTLSGLASYAGVPIEKTQLTIPRTNELLGVALPESVSLIQDQTCTVEGQVEMRGSAEGVALRAESGMDDLCAVVDLTNADADGRFTLTLAGRRAGTVPITLYDEDGAPVGGLTAQVLNVEPVEPVLAEGDYRLLLLGSEDETAALRAAPDGNSAVIFDDLMDGFIVRALETTADGAWLKVEYLGQTGYLPAAQLSQSLNGRFIRVADEERRVRTRISANINLWSTPSKDESLKTVSRGDTLILLCALEGTSWYYAVKDGVYGYVNGRYLQ